jgi:hypothetical protein
VLTRPNLVADGDADEVFAHPAGDVREDFVAIGQFDPEHGAGEHRCDGSGQFDVLFSWHGERQKIAKHPANAAKKSTFSATKNKWTFAVDWLNSTHRL